MLHVRHCFSGRRLIFKFLPFYLVESEILFSVGAGQLYIWKIWDGGGDGIGLLVCFLTQHGGIVLGNE